MPRDFDISDVLTITDGRLVSTRHIEGVYDLLNFMTGDNLMTHQLPRASLAAAPIILEQHPQLAGCGDGVDFGDSEDVEEIRARIDDWLAPLRSQMGDTLPLTPMDEWHRMDPVQELAEMTETPDRIMVVSASSSIRDQESDDE